MCIYTVKEQKLKKSSSRGLCDTIERQKIWRPGVKDTVKTNKH